MPPLASIIPGGGNKSQPGQGRTRGVLGALGADGWWEEVNRGWQRATFLWSGYREPDGQDPSCRPPLRAQIIWLGILHLTRLPYERWVDYEVVPGYPVYVEIVPRQRGYRARVPPQARGRKRADFTPSFRGAQPASTPGTGPKIAMKLTFTFLLI